MTECSMLEMLPWFGGEKGTVEFEYGEYRKLMAFAYQQDMDGVLEELIDAWDADGYCVPHYEEYKKVTRKEITPTIHKLIENTDGLAYADVY